MFLSKPHAKDLNTLKPNIYCTTVLARERSRASPCIDMRGQPKMHGEKEMIDEQATFEKYGYYSTDWKPKSHKKIVAVCDECGAVRYPAKYGYSDLCQLCSNQSAERRKAISNGNRGKIRSDEFRANVSKTTKGRILTDEHKRKIGDGNRGKKYPPHTDEHRQHISAGYQGIQHEEWTRFAKDNPYCKLFNNACREHIREKYEYRCFICNKPQDENVYKSGKQIALSVHHYDMNKDQGCNGHEWKLVPVCLQCHNKTHSKMWQARIEYLLENVWE